MKTTEILQKLIRGNDAVCATMMKKQVMDETHADYGGYYLDSVGYASPCHGVTATYIECLAIALFSEDSCYFRDKDMLHRLLLACDFVKRSQRESGFIDLIFKNYDSPPDTAFCVFLISIGVHLARMADIPESKDFEEAIAPFIRSAATAIANDGFHTPNHRWMIVGALALAWELYPDLPVTEAINAYLAEGIDVNEDGFFCERSNGTYTGEEAFRLMVASQVLDRPDICDLVHRAMQCMSHYFYCDYTVDTSISGRQDALEKKIYPTNAIENFLYFGLRDQNGEFMDIALHLLDVCAYNSPGTLYLLKRNLSSLPEALPEAIPLPDTDIFMQDAGVYRKRKGALGVTLKAYASGFLKIQYGDTTLSEVRLFAPYFGGAKFVPVEMTKTDTGFTLRFISQFATSFLPGYMKPLGYEREIRGWGYNRGDQISSLELPQYTMLEGREIVKRPEFTFYLDITEIENGYRLFVRTEGGMDQVPFLAEFLFLPDGRVETDSLAFPARSGETVFLKKGALTYCTKYNYIRIAGGNDVHRNLNSSEGADGLFRAVITDMTPVAREMEITFGTLDGGKPV